MSNLYCLLMIVLFICFTHSSLVELQKVVSSRKMFNANGLLVNASKTNDISFHTGKQKNIKFELGSKNWTAILERKTTVKFLGTLIDECLTWKYQIYQVVTKISKSLVIIRVMKLVLYQKDLKALYNSLIHPDLTYGIEVWGNAGKGQISRVQNMQRK